MSGVVEPTGSAKIEGQLDQSGSSGKMRRRRQSWTTAERANKQASSRQREKHFAPKTRAKRKMLTSDSNNINNSDDIDNNINQNDNNNINNNNNILPSEQNANYYPGPLLWNHARRSRHENTAQAGLDTDGSEQEDNSVNGRKYANLHATIGSGQMHARGPPQLSLDTYKISSGKASALRDTSLLDRMTLLADDEPTLADNYDTQSGSSRSDSKRDASKDAGEDEQQQHKRGGPISSGAATTSSVSTSRQTVLPQITIPDNSKVTPPSLLRTVRLDEDNSVAGAIELHRQQVAPVNGTQIANEIVNHSETGQSQAQVMNSTNSILFLIIGYMLWQCFFKNSRFSRCLCPGKLRRPLSRRFFDGAKNCSSQSGSASHSGCGNKLDSGKTPVTSDSALERETSLIKTTTTNCPDEAESDNCGQTDAIRVATGQQEQGIGREKTGDNLARLKRVLAKNSFVVAAKRGTSKPKVKLLITERLTKLGFIANMSANGEQQQHTGYGHMLRPYVLRLSNALGAGWLSGFVSSGAKQSDLEAATLTGRMESAQKEGKLARQQDKLANEGQCDDSGEMLESSALLARNSNTPPTTQIEVHVHRNAGAENNELANVDSPLDASRFGTTNTLTTHSRSSQLSNCDKSSDATTATTGQTIQPAHTKSHQEDGQVEYVEDDMRAVPVTQLNSTLPAPVYHQQQAALSPSPSEACHNSSSTPYLSHSLQSSLYASNNVINTRQVNNNKGTLQVNYSANGSEDLSSATCGPLNGFLADNGSPARSQSQSTGANYYNDKYDNQQQQQQHQVYQQQQPQQQQRYSLNCYQLIGRPSQAKSVSPSNFRPCCSVSPSALGHHEHLEQRYSCNIEQQQGFESAITGATTSNNSTGNNHELLRPLAFSHNTLVKCGNSAGTSPADRAHSTTASCSSGQTEVGRHTGSIDERVKQQYENYYEDEQEQTYRRLTASIGVQFGLAFDHHHQHHLEQLSSARLPPPPIPPSMTAACGGAVQSLQRHHHQQHHHRVGGMACRYCASPTNAIKQQADGLGDNLLVGPPCDHLQTSSGDTSLGGSDSGSFSLAMASKADLLATGFTCSNPNCVTCRSATPPLGPVQLKQQIVGGGSRQQHPNMSIFVQQPSVSTTPPLPLPLSGQLATSADSTATPLASDGVHSQQQQQQQQQAQQQLSCLADGQSPQVTNGWLVSYRNQRRRSTMSGCSRPSRRMSVAGVANWQAPHQAAATYNGAYYAAEGQQQHNFLHRASIASDGSSAMSNFSDNGQHPLYQNHSILARNQFGPATHGQRQFGASQQIGNSQYSSQCSAGSSSGIGFSGSQCTNTPTASVFPYGSLASTNGKQHPEFATMFPYAEQMRAPLIGPHQKLCCAPPYDQFDHLTGIARNQVELAYPMVQEDQNQLAGTQLDDKYKTRQQQHLFDPIMCQGSVKGLATDATSASYSNRKYSLPVQLESNVAESYIMQSSSCTSSSVQAAKHLLFDIDDNSTATVPLNYQSLPLNRGSNQMVSPQQLASYTAESGTVETGPSGWKSAHNTRSQDSSRRYSQTFARQSSFWLEDSGSACEQPMTNEQATSEPSQGGEQLWAQRSDLELGHQKPDDAQSPSPSGPASSGSTSSPSDDDKKSAARLKQLPAPRQPSPATSPSLSSSSSSSSSDFAPTHFKGARSSGMGPKTASISKRRPPARLRSRRSSLITRRTASATTNSNNNNDTSDRSALERPRRPMMKHTRYGRDCAASARSSRHSFDVNGSTDDEQELERSRPPRRAPSLREQKDARKRRKSDAKSESSEQDDEFGPPLDRDFLTAPVGTERSGRTSSTSLERQCRDLWKLRSTLQNDASMGRDNWASYHRRLNCRYDSGYKSIENQFSSSVDGNTSSSHYQPSAPPPTNQSGATSSPATNTTTSTITSSITTSAIASSALVDRPDGPPQRRASQVHVAVEPDPLLARPQSGCSGYICDLVAPPQQADAGQRPPSAQMNEQEEMLALLDDCDDPQDESFPFDCEPDSDH